MEDPTVSIADPERKRFDGNLKCGKAESCACTPENQVVPGAAPKKKPLRILNQIPEDILNDPDINRAIAQLPSNYNFEVHKCIWHLKKYESKRVALQFPEGLLYAAHLLSDILTLFCPGLSTVIMGDVTYGACCVDDFTAETLGCDFLIHYGHSCLIPINQTNPKVRMLYVFVEIGIDNEHVVQLVRAHWKPESKFAILGIVQFVSALQHLRHALPDYNSVYIPQAKPLSPGEVLGCTSPTLPAGTESFVFIADGRFHLESTMIANPTVQAFRYDPYTKKMTREHYDHLAMRRLRKEAILSGMRAKRFGLILGTLGRQGSPVVLNELRRRIKERGLDSFVVLLSEIRPEKLALFGDKVDAWVQVACPRLSIDWGHYFSEGGRPPLLSPYELSVVLGIAKPFWAEEDLEAAAYPMDYYSKESSGPWTVNHTPRSG